MRKYFFVFSVIFFISFVSAQNPPLPAIPGPIATLSSPFNPNYPTIPYSRPNFYTSLDITGDGLTDILAKESPIFAYSFTHPQVLAVYSSTTGQRVTFMETVCSSPPPSLCAAFINPVLSGNIISTNSGSEYVTLSDDSLPGSSLGFALKVYTYNSATNNLDVIAAISPLDPVFSNNAAGAAYLAIISPLGDVNNDGNEEFILGYGLDSSSNSYEFYVMNLLPNPNYPSTSQYPYILNVLYSSLVPGSIAPVIRTIAAIEDITGDSVKDIFVSRSFNGANYLFDGSSGALLPYNLIVPSYVGSQSHEITGISSIGDISGDGYSEVAATRYHYGAGSGRYDVEVHNVVSGMMLYLINDPTPLTGFEYGTGDARTIEDINGNGIRELVIQDAPDSSLGSSCSNVADRLLIYLPGQNSATLLRSIIDPNLPLCYAQLGKVRYSIGDQDSDGIDELAVQTYTQALLDPLTASYKLFGARGYGSTTSTGATIPGQTLTLTSTASSPGNGLQQRVTASGGTPNSLGVLLVSRFPQDIAFGNNHLWVDVNNLGLNPIYFNYDSNGQFSFTSNINDPNVPLVFGQGATFYVQFFDLPGQNIIYNSNGLQFNFAV